MNKAALLACCVFLAASPARAQSPAGVRAASADAFLNSLGVNTHVAQGYNPAHYAEPLHYLGIRNIRDGARNLSGYFMLHKKDGIRVDLVGAKIDDLLDAARPLAENDVLMAIEGPNEPNNWPITYMGVRGGGKESWGPVADMQADLYKQVKADPVLKKYPVFDVSEAGAETNNVGLQFLTIPPGAKTQRPAGTVFADYANVHNYVSGHGQGYVDNEAWQAADPTLDKSWDGLYGEYGKTWRGKFAGYADAQLETLPRVTTETGWDSVNDPGGEAVQGTILVNTLLAQFKRGWAYTFIYELGDGEGSTGNQGLYRKDWTPKPAADYIHNLTTILADDKPRPHTGALAYTIADQPATVHDLLLQKSDGTFFLVIWNEKTSGTDDIAVDLAAPRRTVRIYDVTRGTDPVATLHHTAHIPLTLGDHAMIVELPGR
ncbi:MAG: glycosyl hydrolase [Alphaproteobacteria bacterium]|nr:glycosyl hydrolase [Alphaproteobacteria bacterium]